MLSILPAERIGAALETAGRVRPRVGGFPYLAEALRVAGVRTVHIDVAGCTTVYRFTDGAAISRGEPLTGGLSSVAAFDADALVAALRRDQAGDSTYREFMVSTWAAGVVDYDVDLSARTCTYRGALDGDVYVESYAAVDLPD